MKVLYIQDSLGTGGAERSNAELWYYLRSKEIQIKIIVLEHREVGIEQEILDAEFDVEFLKPGSFINQVLQIENIVKHFKPDLVHSVLFKAAMRTRSAKQLIDFTNIESLVNCTYAEIRYQDPKINSKALKIYEKVDKLSEKIGVDHFVAITKEVAEHYQKHLSVRSEKISVIPRGRKGNDFLGDKDSIRKQLEKEIDVNPDGPIFIHVGRQEFQKAHLDIIKAIERVDADLSQSGAQFLFCGREGNATSQIKKTLDTANINTTLHFLGHRNDIYELLAAADVFVFPSLFEGLGGSLIEAQAAGLPIICSDIPVFKEVVTRENALFHKVNDPESLSVQFLKVLETDRKRMGEASLKNYVHNFKLEEVNKKMLKLYRNLLK